MKIFHLIHKIQNRGAETFACQLAKHQEMAGHQVEIMAIHNGNASLPWKKQIRTLQPSQKLGFLDFRATKRLSDFISDFNPDIIQANSGDTLKFLVLSKKVFGWKAPIVFRNASEVGRYLSSSFQKKFNAFLYKETKAVISVSNASKKDFISHFPFSKGRIQVIPVGLEMHDKIEAVNLKPADRKHIIHVGGFTFEKNHEELLAIFDLVQKKLDQVHLHLLGDGPLRERIEMKVKEAGMETHVSFYGFVKNPLNYIKASNVLVLPSLIEGLPGVILEAMYCKVPVVAYNVGGISEIVSDRTGSLIIKGDVQTFAKAVCKSLETPDTFKVQEAYGMVKKEFMNSVISDKFLSCYKDVLEYSGKDEKSNVLL